MLPAPRRTALLRAATAFRSGATLPALIGAVMGLGPGPTPALAQQPPASAGDSRPASGTMELFRTADVCMACHNGLVTTAGQDISIGSDWRASMMANAARDPYWQAGVRREVMDHPSASAGIQDECSKCHMPAMRFEAHLGGGTGEVFANAPAAGQQHRAAALAADGVTCTVCHQITDDGLGTRESFVGGFVVDTTRAWGERRVFGPFDVDAGRTTVMRSATRFVPTRASHLQGSELCATCHTLYTHTRNEAGEVIGELPEQVPYLEWRHSAFADERSCQSCHMPVVGDSTPVTSVLPVDRPEVSRHVFRGGNFFMLRMLNRYRDELGVTALPQELDAAATRTQTHLETSTARLSVPDVRVSGGRLRADVRVENLAGHKLPTAYPSRRAWLHVAVRDAAGDVVFESGAFRADGSIAGNDNDEYPDRYEPHHVVVSEPGQVQIYESIMEDPGGRVTTGLLTAIRYAKDNRLLPRGFDKGTAHADIAVLGAAAADPDFTGGSDVVRYDVSVPAGSGPYTVEAELWFQPIAFRWAENLAQYDAPEPNRFVSWYRVMAEGSAVVLARAVGEAR